MDKKVGHTIAVGLMLLILFSSIGFNIISTFCDGCDIEQTTIALTKAEQELDCTCCTVEDHVSSCCSKPTTHSEDHHRTTSILAQLRFDSLEVKSKSFQIQQPVFLTQFVAVLLVQDVIPTFSFIKYIENFSPPLSGRTILKLNCILRN